MITAIVIEVSAKPQADFIYRSGCNVNSAGKFASAFMAHREFRSSDYTEVMPRKISLGHDHRAGRWTSAQRFPTDSRAARSAIRRPPYRIHV